MLTLREAVIADVPRLVELGCHFIEGTPYRAIVGVNPAQLEVLATHLIESPSGAILLSEHGDEITGMLGIVLFNHFVSGESTAGEVFWWVEPDARGHGLRLLREAERWAQARGAKHMQMIAPDDRVGSLYARRGYVEVERTYQRSFA